MKPKDETALEAEYRMAHQTLDIYNVSRFTEYSYDSDIIIFGNDLRGRITEFVDKERNDYLKKVEETKKILITVIQSMLLDQN